MWHKFSTLKSSQQHTNGDSKRTNAQTQKKLMIKCNDSEKRSWSTALIKSERNGTDKEQKNYANKQDKCNKSSKQANKNSNIKNKNILKK